MYTQRMLTVIILVPILILIIMLGGWALTLSVTALMAIGGWEFWRLFKKGGHCPSLVLLSGGTAALLLAYGFFGFRGSQLVLAGLVLLAMGWFVISFERKSCSQPGSDFVITLGGIVYLGWLAIFVIALRQLPNGQWWMLTALPPIWLADGGAYLIGRKIGKHKMAPRTSPGKSWEGYFAGVLFGGLGTMGLAFLWGMRAPEITPLIGLLIGTVISILAPLGDLGESMLKRQFGVKDSGVLFPGHGGVLDRADSTLWAAAIGYLLILLVR